MITMNHVLYLFPTHKFRWEHRGQTQGQFLVLRQKTKGRFSSPLKLFKKRKFCRNNVKTVKNIHSFGLWSDLCIK